MKRWILCLLVVCLMFSFSVEALTSSQIKEEISRLEEEEEALKEEMEELEEKLSSNLSEINAVAEQKSVLDRQMHILHLQAGNLEQQIAQQNLVIAEKQEELAERQSDYKALNKKHKARIRAMEENGSLRYWSVLFSADSFWEFLDRLSMIEEIAAADDRRLRELKDAADAVSLAEAALLAERKAMEDSAAELTEAKAAFEEKRRESDLLIRNLVARREEYRAILEESELAQEALMEKLAKLESDYEKAKEQENRPQNPVPPSSSGWITPVPYYYLSSPFGMRLHPELGVWRMHNGIDMACAAYTPIYAARSGVITVTDYQEYGAGNYVQIDHGDGFRSIYMHMIYYVVRPGQQVKQGEVIGYVGSTGLSSGDHLHFGISYNGTYVNPIAYLP